MRIKILMITYNRPHYTRLSLERLCGTAPSNAKIIVWDNASDEETIKVLKGFERHRSVEKIIYNKTNDKLRGPTNWFWKNCDADLYSKVDDDCLMPDRWCETLEKSHREIEKLGIIGCWRFLPEDFMPEKASKKIQGFGRHLIMRNCWVEGSGYLMKKSVIQKLGILRDNESFTDYCIRASAKGFINGWYYPFLYQEHMDDPRAEHTGIKSEADFIRLIPLSARQFGIGSKNAWTERLRKSARRLQEYSIDPYDFIGLKAKLKRKIYSLTGKEYFPKIS